MSAATAPQRILGDKYRLIPLASARGTVAVLPPATHDPSSSTLDRHERARPRALVWLAPVVACVAIALALQGVRRPSVTTDAAPREGALEAASQPLAPPPATAGLIVLGEGSELRASVDGQDIGPVPCEVEGVVPGDHTVVISGTAGYRPSHHRVHLEPGAVATIGPVRLEVDASVAAGVDAEAGSSAGAAPGVPSSPAKLEAAAAAKRVPKAKRGRGSSRRGRSRSVSAARAAAARADGAASASSRPAREK